MQNATFGAFVLDTDSHDGDKLEIRHVPSGDRLLINSDGGLAPAGYESLPTSPDDQGTIYYDQNRNLPAWWDGDHYEWPNFVDDVLTEPETVAGTTTSTVVWDPDINANSLIEGRTYQIDLTGRFSTANTSSTFTVDIDLAGTDVAGIQNVGGNVTDAPWSVEFSFTVQSDGQNGTLQPHTRGLFNTDATGSDHDTVSVDTTSVTALSVSLQWDDASAGNSVTLSQAHLKQMA